MLPDNLEIGDVLRIKFTDHLGKGEFTGRVMNIELQLVSSVSSVGSVASHMHIDLDGYQRPVLHSIDSEWSLHKMHERPVTSITRL